MEEVGDYGRIYTVTSPRAPFGDSRYRLMLPDNYLFSPENPIRRILYKEQPDLIEICDKYALHWLAGLIRKKYIRELGRPVLVGLSCERMNDNVAAYLGGNRLLQKLSRLYAGTLYQPMFDYHIANSTYTADELLQTKRDKHDRHVFVCPMGAKFDDLQAAQCNAAFRNDLLKQMGGNGRSRLLFYAGRLSKEKNIPLLVEMMKSLSRDTHQDYRLLIAGDGPLANWLADTGAEKLHNRLLLLGHISERAKLAALYANCDAFIHPNPREPFGIAPLEAMAAGLPLVAPKSGGVLSYANATNAWLERPHGELFADAVRVIFADNKERERRIAAAKKTAERYRWEIVTAKFFALYDRMYRDFPLLPFAPKRNTDE